MTTTYIGTLMPGESASVEFPSGKVTKPAQMSNDEGWCIPPLFVPDWSGEVECTACGATVEQAKFMEPGKRDYEGNFPQYARMKRQCYRCGHSWIEATKAGTERRQQVLDAMPEKAFKPGDHVVYLNQQYAEDGNTKTHIEEIAGCVVEEDPFLSNLSSGDHCWRYPTKVPGWNHNLTLAQSDLRLEAQTPLSIQNLT